MKKSIWMGLMVIALACVVGLAACAPKEPAPAAPAAKPDALKKDAKPAEPTPATPPTEGTAPAAPAAPAEGAAAAPAAPAEGAAAAPAEGAALNAQTLVGTKWKYDAFEFKFEPDGQLKVNDAIPGTWKLEGNKLTVTAMGQEHSVEIQGAKMMFNGEELQQVK